jgi:hypothetical protein
VAETSFRTSPRSSPTTTAVFSESSVPIRYSLPPTAAAPTQLTNWAIPLQVNGLMLQMHDNSMNNRAGIRRLW